MLHLRNVGSWWVKFDRNSYKICVECIFIIVKLVMDIIGKIKYDLEISKIRWYL